ncbi:MAG: hypothetical protein GX022_10380 [Clostridiaceae bacterium]|nr:hypothetical protein [Clostridiaceae bacterium]
MVWAKEVLFFKDIPSGYRENEKIIFAGVDFSGIQSFIYQDDSMESLNEIAGRSEYIQLLTVKINEELTEILEDYFYTPITVSSGKIQAIIKNNKNAQSIFENHLKKVQETVFLENQGKIGIFYGTTHAQLRNRDSGAYNDAFLALANVIERNKYQSYNLYVADSQYLSQTPYSVHSLLPKKESGNSVSLDSIKLAAVKMDFDNLGNLFSSIREADVKAGISKTITETINEAFSEVKNIHLIYAGGDDIFFICRFKDMIEVIQTVYLNIKRRVYEESALADYKKDFGISCGICLFHKDVPIIHYMDNAEIELLKSKDRGKNRITAENLSISWDEWQELYEIMQRCSHVLEPKKRDDLYSFKFRHYLKVLGENYCEPRDRDFIRQLLTTEQ